jgi:hypothetical protein
LKEKKMRKNQSGSKKVKEAPPSQNRDTDISRSGLGKEAVLYAGVFMEVVDFIFENYSDAVEDILLNEWNRVFPDGLDDPSAVPVMMTFNDWLIHTPGVIETGYTGIELYLEKADRLPGARRKMLERMNDSVVSLFELRISEDGNSVHYTDLALGDEFELYGVEKSDGGDHMLAGARRIVLDGSPITGMAMYPFPFEEKEYLLQELREELATCRIEEPDTSMEECLRVIDPIPDLWLDGFEEDDETGGEDAAPGITYAALFDILDRKGTLAKLRTIPSLHAMEKDVFEWIDDPNDPEQESRGAVVVEENGMVLGAYTPEMREAGKIMLLSVCSGLIRHRRDLEVNEDSFDTLDGES